MVSDTRWALIDYQHSWVGNTKHLVLTTDRSCHLWMRITRRYPYKRTRWVVFRGVAQRHSDAINFVIRSAIEQQEDGDTITHTFDFPDWEICDQYYWYFSGFIDDISSDSNTAIFTQHFTGENGPAPPEPTTDVITWDVPTRLIRCGNRYTFWANSTWYVFIPTVTSLTMWKLVGGVFMQMDPGNEPFPPAGVITDGDARLEVLSDHIACVYFNAVASPGPHQVYFALFSHTLDEWTFHQLICEPLYSIAAYHHCSLSLDADDKPHVVYLDFPTMLPEVHFRHRIGINWSAPEIAIKQPGQIISAPSCWIDSFWGNFHVTAVANTSAHWYNRRLSGPQTWDGNTQMGTNNNLGHQSIMAGDRIPHVAGISTTWKVDHWEDQPPVTNQQNLSAATSTYANMIAPPDVGGALAIVFSNLAHFLGLLYRPPLMPWLPEASPAGTDVIELACHYAYPDIISCLWERPGAMATSFYAFWAPWH